MTTADGAFQMFKPNFIKNDQYHKIFDLNSKLNEIPVKQIGLIPPYLEIIHHSVHLLKGMGFSCFGIPLQEMAKDVNDPSASKINRWFLRQFDLSLRGYRSIPLVIVSGSPNLPILGDYYSSLTWRFPSKAIKYMHLSKSENQEARLLDLLQKSNIKAELRNADRIQQRLIQ